jgi:hypothetical protein
MSANPPGQCKRKDKRCFHQFALISKTAIDKGKMARPPRFELAALCLEVAGVLLSKLAGAGEKQGKISEL